MKAYFFKTPNKLNKLKQGDNLVGRLVLPHAGNYIIQAKAYLASVDARFNYQELFVGKLSCMDTKDEVSMAIFANWGSYTSLYDPPRPAFAEKPAEPAGKEAVIFLQIALKIDAPNIANLSIFYVPQNQGLLLQSASILAYQVDELEIHDTFPTDEVHRYHKNDVGQVFSSLVDLVKVTR